MANKKDNYHSKARFNYNKESQKRYSNSIKRKINFLNSLTNFFNNKKSVKIKQNKRLKNQATTKKAIVIQPYDLEKDRQKQAEKEANKNKIEHPI